jgi:uncharacterized membrane protein YfcA
VLLYLGARLLHQAARPASEARQPSLAHGASRAVVRITGVSLRRIEYEFLDESFSFKPATLLALGLAVGLVGGIYGIGGGALIAPFLVVVMGLPLYSVAGACLFATFATSLAGVAFFELLGLTSLGAGAPVRPDWALGTLFGIGGLVGTYIGARLQKFLPERWIRLVLGVLVTGLGLGYIGQFLL